MSYKSHDDLMDETRSTRHKPKPVGITTDKSTEVTRMNRLCFSLLGTDEGIKLLDYLERMAVGNHLLRKDSEGRIDPYASVATARAREIFDSIRQMTKFGEQHE